MISYIKKCSAWRFFVYELSSILLSLEINPASDIAVSSQPGWSRFGWAGLSGIAWHCKLEGLWLRGFALFCGLGFFLYKSYCVRKF